MNFRTNIYFFIFFINSIGICVAQTKEDAKIWAKQLNEPQLNTALPADNVWAQWQEKDISYCKNALILLKNEIGNNPSKNIEIKIGILEILVASIIHPENKLDNPTNFGINILQLATAAGDEHLITASCRALGIYYLKNKQQDKGLFYILKSISLLEKLKYSSALVCNEKLFTSSYLYSTRNYENCISFCHDILATPTIKIEPINLISVYNNIGLSYAATNKYDSAIDAFKNAISIAEKNNIGVWVGIASGNIGNVLKLQKKWEEAILYWQKDLDTCMKYKEWKEASIVSAYMSEYYFNKGEKEKAFQKINSAAALVFEQSSASNFITINRLKSHFFEQTKQYDSAIFYLRAYHRLDNAETENVTKTRFQQMSLLLDFDNSSNEYKLVQKEKQAEVIKRNFLLIALLIALLTGWLFINRQRLRFKIATQRKIIAENEIASAKAQLQLFTQTLIEKNEQIEQLNLKLDSVQQKNENELTSHTILTDDDWNRFKALFEKVHPQFFDKLKQLSPEITAAEIRLAALIKLNLNNKQMASMQGISVSSIRGNKTRLRQRLNITVDNDLDVFIKEI
jgi:tetratricopeptide (TPR) repeat protein/DNA-binding CsgD family transcriptional regulator